jgi:hypothetical protein
MKAFKKEIYWQCDLMAMKKSNVACVHRRTISQYDSGERCGPWASCSLKLLVRKKNYMHVNIEQERLYQNYEFHYPTLV